MFTLCTEPLARIPRNTHCHRQSASICYANVQNSPRARAKHFTERISIRASEKRWNSSLGAKCSTL